MDLQAAAETAASDYEHGLPSDVSSEAAYVLLREMDRRGEEITELGDKLVAANRRLDELEKVDLRAKDARKGSYLGETPDYERGWLAAADYIHGSAK